MIFLMKKIFIKLLYILGFILVANLARGFDHDDVEKKVELADEMHMMFRNSHGRVGNRGEEGHYLHHYVGCNPEPKEFGGIGEILDNKVSGVHSIFHDCNPEKIFFYEINKETSEGALQLQKMKPGERSKIEVNLRDKNYKGPKGFVEFHRGDYTSLSHHAALPPYIQRADKAVFIVDKPRNGKGFHLQTAYPMKKPVKHYLEHLGPNVIESLFPENPKEEYMKNVTLENNAEQQSQEESDSRENCESNPDIS
jgi:hypothetical protein